MNKNKPNLLIALVALTICDAPVSASDVHVWSKSQQNTGKKRQAQPGNSKLAVRLRQKPWTAEERAQKVEEVVQWLGLAIGSGFDEDAAEQIVLQQPDVVLNDFLNFHPSRPPFFQRCPKKYLADVIRLKKLWIIMAKEWQGVLRIARSGLIKGTQQKAKKIVDYIERCELICQAPLSSFMELIERNVHSQEEREISETVQHIVRERYMEAGDGGLIIRVHKYYANKGDTSF